MDLTPRALDLWNRSDKNSFPGGTNNKVSYPSPMQQFPQSGMNDQGWMNQGNNFGGGFGYSGAPGFGYGGAPGYGRGFNGHGYQGNNFYNG